MGVIFEFYAAEPPVEGVVVTDAERLRETAVQIDDISINSSVMGTLAEWLAETPLKPLVDDPEDNTTALLVGRAVSDALIAAHTPADDPEDVVTVFVDALERSADAAEWREASLGIVVG